MIADVLPVYIVGPRPGYVYLALGHPSGAVKIGFTCDLSLRYGKHTKQYGYPVYLIWAAFVRDAQATETMLHQHFKTRQVGRGEWFDIGRHEVELIKTTLTHGGVFVTGRLDHLDRSALKTFPCLSDLWTQQLDFLWSAGWTKRPG